MTKYIALASLILLAPAASAQNLNWAKIGGYERFTAKNAIVPTNGVYTDPSGNTYVAGYVLGVVDPSQVSNGGYDAFVIKYDSSGNQKWVQQFGSNLGDFALAVTADTSGNVYVAGYTFGSLGGVANAGGSRIADRADSTSGETHDKRQDSID